jgi:esterase/lipase superfamily enzyme
MRFEFRENPEKHVVVLNTVQQSYTDFYGQMKERIVNSQGHEAFIFVHGYDVSFLDAARRTGQIAYDLGFDGAPIFYSWPSQANLASYIVDENNIDWTTQHLVWFVQDVVRQTQPGKIHLMAHSMGSRALVHVLTDAAMRTVGSGGPPITEVIFMAPDMDADTFKQFAREFHGSSKRVTLYASSNDEALKQSQKLHGNPRAGESGKSLVLLPGVDTIDASAADTSAIGHWYYAERRSVLSDVFYLFKDGKPASERFGLVQKRLNNMVYYYFKP